MNNLTVGVKFFRKERFIRFGTISQTSYCPRRSENKLMLQHKHLIITAKVKHAPRDVDYIQDWLRLLIKQIDMEILMGPYAVYYDVPGNKGITAFSIITTSHIGLHTFEEGEGEPTRFELDVYSCKDFDINDVFNALKEFEIIEASYKFLDRENNLNTISFGHNPP